MTSPSKRKGDAAEREAAALLTDLLGMPVRRKLGAGRADDCGDLDGIPGWTLECKYRPGDVARAVREGLDDATREQVNAGTTHGAALVRRPGGRWFVALTLEQFATVVRELLPDGTESAGVGGPRVARRPLPHPRTHHDQEVDHE